MTSKVLSSWCSGGVWQTEADRSLQLNTPGTIEVDTVVDYLCMMTAFVDVDGGTIFTGPSPGTWREVAVINASRAL